jgi:hypothetical protein
MLNFRVVLKVEEHENLRVDVSQTLMRFEDHKRLITAVVLKYEYAPLDEVVRLSNKLLFAQKRCKSFFCMYACSLLDNLIGILHNRLFG